MFLLSQTEVKKAQPREVMQSLQGGRGRAGRGMAGRGFCKLLLISSCREMRQVLGCETHKRYSDILRACASN